MSLVGWDTDLKLLCKHNFLLYVNIFSTKDKSSRLIPALVTSLEWSLAWISQPSHTLEQPGDKIIVVFKVLSQEPLYYNICNWVVTWMGLVLTLSMKICKLYNRFLERKFDTDKIAWEMTRIYRRSMKAWCNASWFWRASLWLVNNKLVARKFKTDGSCERLFSFATTCH